MDWGSGTYIIVDKNTVIRVSKSSGVSAYSYQICKNGITIDEGYQMYPDEDDTD